MATIAIDLPDEGLLKVMQAASAEGRSLNDHVVMTLLESLEHPEDGASASTGAALVESILERSINFVLSIDAGSEFFLSDVCNAEDWAALDAGQRKSLGKKFRNQVTDRGLASWKGRCGNNHALYVRSDAIL